MGTAVWLGVLLVGTALLASCSDASVAPVPANESPASTADVVAPALSASSAPSASPIRPVTSATPAAPAIASAAPSGATPASSASSAPAAAKPACPTSLSRGLDYGAASTLHPGVKRGWTQERVIQHMGGPKACAGSTWIYVAGPRSGPEITTHVTFAGGVVTSVHSSTVGCRLEQ